MRFGINNLIGHLSRGRLWNWDPEEKQEIFEALHNTVGGWLSSPLEWNIEERNKLKEDIKSLSPKELATCIDILKNELEKNVISLLFWDIDTDKIWKSEFSWYDLWGYSDPKGDKEYYLYSTDFWNVLANKHVILKWIWWDRSGDEFALSLQYWIDRSVSDGVCVNIPFNFKGSDKYKVDVDKIVVSPRWNKDKKELAVRLVEFLQKTQDYSWQKISSRKLWCLWAKSV